VALSARLAAVVDALPLRPDMRVLEIGCGPGAAARAVAERLTTGHILAIDRSATAVAQATAGAAGLIVDGRLRVRQAAAEDFVAEPGEGPFDLVFAVRVGALDGRHPAAGQKAFARIAAVLAPGGRLFVDGHEVALR
jgi:cyclopropane fatty-acyl-phospholipid synthase-like methyltransferase